jgi:peptidyl-tRNA hydrolase, PTH1 family
VRLIVGLGNPGIEYQFTLHNLGFLTIDRLAQRHGVHIGNRRCRSLTGKAVIANQEALLAKPETYMNHSGLAVRELVEEYEIDPASELIVVYDELDLPFASLRVRQRGSAGGHHGMESIIGALGTTDFARVRIGIAPGFPLRDGASYVLSQIKRSQEPAVDEALDAAACAVETILSEGVNAAMNRFNKKPAAATEE